MAKKNDRRKTWARIMALVLAGLLVAGIIASTVITADAEGTQTEYSMTLSIDDESMLSGVSQRVFYTNSTGRELEYVMFNLYANVLRRSSGIPVEDWDSAFPDGFAPGGVVFSSVTVNGEKAEWALSGDNEQCLRVACHLKEGEQCEFGFEYYILMSDNAWLLGAGKNDWRLTNFYPSVCVYDSTLRDFMLNSWTAVTDPLIADCAKFSVTVAAKSGYTPAAAGNIAVTGSENGITFWHIDAENLRSLSLVLRKNANTVRNGAVTASADRSNDAKMLLDMGKRIYDAYAEMLGGCERELYIVQSDTSEEMTVSGGVVQVNAKLLKDRDALEDALARGIATLWFGETVGCNTEYEPWLRDALCAYLPLLYFERSEGYDGYLKRLNDRVLASLQITLPGGLTVDSDAGRFTSRSEYELACVDRGCAVLHEMRDLMGRDTFIEGLRRYIEDNRYRIASVEQFAGAFNEVTGERWDEYIVGQLHTISDYVDQRMEWYE